MKRCVVNFESDVLNIHNELWVSGGREFQSRGLMTEEETFHSEMFEQMRDGHWIEPTNQMIL